MSAEAWMMLAGLIAQAIFFAIGGMKALAGAKEEIKTEIHKNRREVDDSIDVVEKRFGETIGAIRVKITEIEIWNRDNFARRDNMDNVMGRFEKQITMLDEKFMGQFQHIDGKLDALRNAAIQDRLNLKRT